MKLDRRGIESFIPHRPPFLFLEEAELVSSQRILARARWDASHPILAGHFPDFPIVPGVLIVEAAAQAAGVLVAANLRAPHGPATSAELPEETSMPWQLGVLTGIRRASFNKPVFAGDTLLLDVVLGHTLGNMMTASAEASAEGLGPVFKSEFNVAVIDWSHITRGTP